MSLIASRVLILTFAVVAITGTAFAQTAAPAHVPLQKTIGAAKPDVVPSLFVLNSKGATLRGGELALIGISQNAIVFADRPVLSAGHDSYQPHCRGLGIGQRQFREGSTQCHGLIRFAAATIRIRSATERWLPW